MTTTNPRIKSREVKNYTVAAAYRDQFETQGETHFVSAVWHVNATGPKEAAELVWQSAQNVQYAWRQQPNGPAVVYWANDMVQAAKRSADVGDIMAVAETKAAADGDSDNRYYVCDRCGWKFTGMGSIGMRLAKQISVRLRPKANSH